MNFKINNIEKYKILKKKYSNPDLVFEKLEDYFKIDPNLEYNISTRKNKKYMVKGDFTDNKYVHFGAYPNYEDYTFHKDFKRRANFKARNFKWFQKDINTPAFLSYVILW